jgi:hypothetical protein
VLDRDRAMAFAADARRGILVGRELLRTGVRT